MSDDVSNVVSALVERSKSLEERRKNLCAHILTHTCECVRDMI